MRVLHASHLTPHSLPLTCLVRFAKCPTSSSRCHAKLAIVPDVQDALRLLINAPLLGYSLLAATFLAAVSLLTGWLRLDFLPAYRPFGLLQITVAVALAAALMLLSSRLAEIMPLDIAALSWLGDDYLLAGISRLPLYVIALAYGPSAGLLAAVLYAAFGTQTGYFTWDVAVLALELLILGWLAIYPSPRDYRWAGPLNAFLAYVLAWSTAGLALLAWQKDTVTLTSWWQQQTPGGVLLSILLLFVISPWWYRRNFRPSRIAPRYKLRRHDDPVMLEPLGVSQNREHDALSAPTIPALKRERPRKRELEPAPQFEVLEYDEDARRGNT